MRFRYGLLALLVGVGGAYSASAQESAAVITAKDHLSTQATSLSAGDLADLRASNVYADRRSGSTMVYLTQRHAGIDIYGAITPVAVGADGKAYGLTPRNFQSNVAARANATRAQISASAALAMAQGHARTAFGDLAGTVTRLSDDPESDARVIAEAAASRSTFTYSVFGEPELVYQPLEDGSLRLAWSTIFEADRGEAQLWAVRVDAVTGQVLAIDDLVARHHRSDLAHLATPTPASYAPVAQPAPALLGGPQYNVVPWPFESPNHGAHAVVSDPAFAASSPNGWHDTGSTQYTITRGNNVFAYLDRDANNSPDAGGSPDGGASLDFSGFSFDPEGSIDDNADAAVVNLFYWNNVAHDIAYQYGFDEASGNFQVNNFGNGGNGNDAVNAEALDGSGTDNANFSTPPDGGSGRMQMFEWLPATVFSVQSPPDIAGAYPSGGTAALDDGSTWGGQTTVSGTVVRANTSGGGFSTGCSAKTIGNPGALSGNIALISRGDCNFVEKFRSAQELGATGIIVANCVPGAPGCSTNSPGEAILGMACPGAPTPDPVMCQDVTIPGVFVTQSTGELLGGSSPQPEATIEFFDESRDSDFDNGIIVHELAHGFSNRLTGGPAAAGCLSNEEQMGEGWSDYYGLLMSMESADGDDRIRGIATYVSFEGTDGAGIRPARYSNDPSINNLTYQDVLESATNGLSIPHGIGSVWASMLWDMTLALTDQFGFDQNAYDADGGNGNQIALNLVTQGMKMQPCSPGFVDGRDGILEADTLLYNGAYSDIIWQAFASRGLGFNADQGSTSDADDGTADFTLPPATSNEAGPNGSTQLAIAGPNPFSARTAVALSLVEPEAVTVEVVDLLGRQVQVLHEGRLAASTRHAFEISAADLAPGVYVVRAEGDSFTTSRRVTVLR